MRILYVEDNPANVFLIQRIARMGNHEVIHYTQGQQALDNFERDKPDMVLMDVQLPGTLDGLDVVRRLRDSGHKVPIIALTAYAMLGDREKCLDAGCDAYLAKPMPVQELIELIKRYEPAASVTPAPAVAASVPPAPEAASSTTAETTHATPAAPDHSATPVVPITPVSPAAAEKAEKEEEPKVAQPPAGT
ncbi:MAG: response regulator [Anaerolineae bacterium]|nr:response regulator [Anaerolineae bacterium]